MCCSFAIGCQTQKEPRPNIVFFLVDDHALKAVSAYEGSLIETPNLDRIANNGMRFDAACVTNAICAPSRTVILTGTHSHINGVVDNGSRFDSSQPTFPLLMQEAGYQTALIGKWHLKSNPVGFDYWEILNGQGQYYSPEFMKSANGSEPVKRILEGYCTDLTTDLTIEWLSEIRNKDEPFLLLCHHKAPHRTWMPGPNQLELFADTKFPEPETLFDDFNGRSSAVSTQEMTISNHMYLWHDLMVPPEDDEPLEGPDKWAQGNLDRMNEEQRTAWDETFDADNDAFVKNDLKGDELTRWKYQRYMQNYLRCIKGIDDNVGRLLDYLEENEHIGNENYINQGIEIEFDRFNSLSFDTRKNFKTDSTEFYNLTYEYLNDCLRAAVEFKREFYSDKDIGQEDTLRFTLSIIPYTKVDSPSFTDF